MFYFSSIILALAAIFLHGTACETSVKSSRINADLMAKAVREEVPYTPDPESARLRAVAMRLNQVGFAVTLLAIVSTVAALRRREPGWYSIPILLIIFGVGTRMLL